MKHTRRDNVYNVTASLRILLLDYDIDVERICGFRISPPAQHSVNRWKGQSFLGTFFRTIKFLVLPIAIVIIWYGNAMAYIDPAAGSYFFQLVMAGVLGGLFVTRRFWQGLRAKFANSKNRSQKKSRD